MQEIAAFCLVELVNDTILGFNNVLLPDVERAFEVVLVNLCFSQLVEELTCLDGVFA